MYKSASKPVISSFYRPKTPLHLNGRLNAQVESDIVGYQTMEITKEFTLLGVSFFSLTDNTQDVIAVNDFVSGEFAHGDQIQIPNATGSYDIAAWNSNLQKWCTERRGNPTTTESALMLEKGDGVWLKTKVAPLTITLKGRVLSDTTAEFDCARQYRLISLPVHEGISVNSPKLAWANLNHKDQIQVTNNSGSYDIAAWNANVQKWCTERRGNPTTTESTLTIPPYEAVWVVSVSADASCTYDSTK